MILVYLFLITKSNFSFTSIKKTKNFLKYRTVTGLSLRQRSTEETVFDGTTETVHVYENTQPAAKG